VSKVEEAIRVLEDALPAVAAEVARIAREATGQTVSVGGYSMPAAPATVPDLATRLAAARDMLGMLLTLRQLAGDDPACCESTPSEDYTLAKRIDALERALRPFADLHGRFEGVTMSCSDGAGGGFTVRITKDMIAAAHAALEG
jgi:hypothetical protein